MTQRFVPPGDGTPNAVLLVDASQGNESVTLPVGFASLRRFTIVRVDSSGNTVTVGVASGQVLDGVSNGTATVSADSQTTFMSIDGATWESIRGGGPGSGAQGLTATGGGQLTTAAAAAADPAWSRAYAPMNAPLPKSFVTRTSTGTASAGEYTLANADSGAFTVNLPADQPVGTLIAVQKTDSTGAVVTVLPASGTINGDANATIVSKDAGGVFEWDGSAWRVVAYFVGSAGSTGLVASNNLSDLTSAATARTNLGLGALATLNSVPAATIGGGKAGDFYVWKQYYGSSSSLPVGWEMAIPFVLPAGRSVAATSILVATAATTGGVARIGWRLDDDGWPGALQADLGTVAVDTTGGKTLTASFSPTPNTLFWVTVTQQVAAATLRQGGNFPLGQMLEGNPLSSDALTAGLRGTPYKDTVTGALGSSFSTRAVATTTSNALPPYVILTLA